MVVYARRDGEESQESAMLRHRAHLRDAVHRVQDRIDSHSPNASGWRIWPSVRRQAADPDPPVRPGTGMTPLRYKQILRAERAEHLIGHGATVQAAAQAAGFADARMLRRLRARPDVPGPDRSAPDRPT